MIVESVREESEIIKFKDLNPGDTFTLPDHPPDIADFVYIKTRDVYEIANAANLAGYAACFDMYYKVIKVNAKVVAD